MMPRWAVHLTVTDELWDVEDPVICVTLNAISSDMAELSAKALIRTELGYDVCDVYEVEQLDAAFASPVEPPQ